MWQFLKRWLLILTVALCAHTSYGFALLGPLDGWQVPALGYDPQNDGGDLGGPKNLTEEWRWNIPEITYGFDASFLNFFGTNGMNAITQALFLYNRELTNLSSLTTADLLRKPAQTRRIHETARALGVMDLKSIAMGMIAEQLGMAGAERWTWALRGRSAVGQVTNYSVIQRNFDPFPPYKPTPYVNGFRYTYQIRQYPNAQFATDFEDAAVVPLDQTHESSGGVSALVGEDLTTTPNLYLHTGEYFAALTRDDIGGLRYMYSRDNVNTEDVLANTSFVTIDPTTVTLINGLDAFSFYTNALFTSPANLLAQFPNLIITSTNFTGISNIMVTNIVITNIISPGALFTNQANGLTFITNQDLFTFSEASRTNPPNALRALYPQLIITSTSSFPVLVQTPVFTLEPAPFGVPGDPPVVVTRYREDLVANYFYTYANVITNYATAVTDMEVQVVDTAPFGVPGEGILATNITTLRVPIPSGGFYILDRTTNANLVAYTFNDANGTPLLRLTNVVGFTNTISSNLLTGARTDTVNRFTNLVYSAYPVFLTGSLGDLLVTNVTTVASLGTWQYTFGNLIFFPPVNGNSNIIDQTTTFLPPALPFTISITNTPAFPPQGTVVILNTNQFVFLTNRFGQLDITHFFGPVTNNLIAFTNAATGAFILEQLIRQTNGFLIAVNPVVLTAAAGPVLRPGVNTLQFKQIRYGDFLNQAGATTTNNYFAIRIVNGVRTTNVFQRIAGADILFGAGDLGVTTGGFPIGLIRNVNFVNPRDGGPGVIGPVRSTLASGAQGTIYFSMNYPFRVNSNPNFMNEEDAGLSFAWGSFDNRTPTPRIYPEDLSGQVTLEQLEAIALGRNPPQ